MRYLVIQSRQSQVQSKLKVMGTPKFPQQEDLTLPASPQNAFAARYLPIGNNLT
ncbi:hypothetical protein FHS90_003611 [Rufibacter quisquiliarum]|uniref:Uncharacterized protein n=1 Tax=Rufibacter quisquiliarum TaxID=1549639 RepID=A0A839GYZ1_9BACT|nr:hypothetical protein [Rufibacter quisquiliarum]